MITSPPPSLEAHEKALLDVFCDKYSFRIPHYQRPYAWTREQASELLDDLRTAFSGAGDVRELAPYFLGSIVLIKRPDHPASDVVDGQQRLTTLTILLSVLRDLSPEDDRDLIHHYVCQKGNRFHGTFDEYRVAPRDRDADFFRGIVQMPGSTLTSPGTFGLSDSQARMVENTSYFRRMLETWDAPQRDRLVSFIVSRCFLVVVAASSQGSAFRIFSVLNSRGLDLSPTDILKAEIIGAVPDVEQEAYNATWEDIEEALGRRQFTDLFGIIRMIYRKQKLRGTLVDEFREFVPAIAEPKSFIENELTPFAGAYADILRHSVVSERFTEDINRHLVYLSRLDNSDWEAPAVLATARLRDNPEALRQFLVDLDRLAYGLFLLRSDATERIARYGRLLNAFETAQDMYVDGSPLQLTALEQGAIRAFLSGDVYLTRIVRQPLLLRLDEALSDEGASYNHSVITVEHVLPQNPSAGSEWIATFPDQEQRDQWVHKLANLVLLSRRKNSAAGNWDFPQKKVAYFSGPNGTSPFALTSTVLRENTWTEETLTRLQEARLKKLVELWRL